jgi:osmotically-inducible protein OsmY
MSKLNLIARFLLALVLVLSVAGCAGTKVTESTGEYFDDSMITAKIKSAILSDSRLKSMDITVSTFKGIVQLSGFVDSKGVVDRAVQVSRTIKGVKAVNNSLVVKQ